MVRWLRVLILRVRSLVWRSAVDRDLDKELRFHLDEHVAELVAGGMEAERARDAAVREFGSTASVAQQCRDTRRVNLIQNLVQDTRYAVRALAKEPALLITAAASIALGVGANLAIFGLANGLLLSTPTATDADRLVHIRTNQGSHTSYSAWRDLAGSGALAAVAGHGMETEMNWRGRDLSISVLALVVTENYFDLLGVPLARGRAFTAAEAGAERDPRVAVLGHAFWSTKLGADPQVIGSTLILNGEPYTAMGVLPPGLRSFPGYGMTPDVYVPISRAVRPDLHAPRAAHLQLIGRLRDDQGPEGARAALNAVAAPWVSRYSDGDGFIRLVAPVGSIWQLNEFKEVALFAGMLLVVTGLVLAIACANVAGLLLARSVARRREIALRLALGASRGRIVQQLLTEGFVLSLAGTSAGLGITAAIGRLVTRASLPSPIPIAFRIDFDTRLALLAMTLVIASTMLCALAPALQATRVALAPSLKQETRRYGRRRIGLRELLVAGQIAVAVLLLVTTMLFVRNITLANTLEPGFDAGRTLVAQVTFVEGRQGGLGSETILRIADRLRSVPGVEASTFSEGMPLTMRYGGNTGTTIRIDGRDGRVRVDYDDNRVGPDYFRVMGIRLLRGREFTHSDRRAHRVAIVNEEFVRRYMDGLEPLGRVIDLPGYPDHFPTEVVGVVANSKYRSIGEDRHAAVYTPHLSAEPGRFVHAIVRTAGPPESSMASIKEAILQTDPAAAVTVESTTQALAFAFVPSRIGAGLVGTLGSLGAVLAMVGLYGVVAFAVTRRTAEIGIRMALGASLRAIALLIAGDGARLVGAGMVVGLLLAVAITRPLAAFLVADLPTTDPISLVVSLVLLGGTSTVAGWAATRRALRIQPAETLRAE